VILFTRAGDQFQDETVFTTSAAGGGEHQVTDPGATCCPRWILGGQQMLFGGSSPDGRISTAFAKPDGTIIRTLPLPAGGLNLACSQAFSSISGLVACEGWDDADQAINGLYVARAADGTGVHRLTSEPMHDRPADFSPDGKQIYFFRPNEHFPILANNREGSIYVVGVNGSGLRQITPSTMPVEVVGNAGGRLSPDGHWVLFTSHGVIWKINVDGSGMAKVFEAPDGRLAITPTWSPDGSLILFGLDPAGSQPDAEVAPPNGLYLIHLDGSGLTSLITSNDWKREPDWAAGVH
jgi:Tol biopolymer transport system component